jgi:hypothetical protein
MRAGPKFEVGVEGLDMSRALAADIFTDDQAFPGVTHCGFWKLPLD